MSAITKTCDTCEGRGHTLPFWNARTDCVDCASTGRVPDVEAENAALRESLARALVCIYGVDATLDDARKVPTVEASLRAELDAARAEVARLTKELADTKRYEQAEYEGRAAAVHGVEQLTAEVERLTTDNGCARDDISRLYDVVWRLTKHHGTACKTRQRMTAPRCVSQCDQCDIDDAAMVAIGAGILHHEQKDTTP